MSRFSWTKTLYDFQVKALEAALKGLRLYYRDEPGNWGQYLRGLYREAGAGDTLKDFDTNRMGFWMATGSGKTLVIVKIIEMLSMLMARGSVPSRDIMFLVYRDSLLEQFKQHVNEYNSSNPEGVIRLIDLKDYEQTKHAGVLGLRDRSISVFYYRADLFFERKKTAKKIRPRSVDNNGNWYVLLDEAHRGDSKDSTLQKIYNDFARNGFLFNFSATFIDEIDRATCAYDFNLQKFTSDGYGKRIYVSGENVEGFDKASPFSDTEKQKVVLKALILQTYIKICLGKIRQVDSSLYHNPLLMTIVNRVTDRGSDLRMFFAELEKIAGGKIKPGLFKAARDELQKETHGATYLFSQDEIKVDSHTLSSITYEDVLTAVFNSATKGRIEVIKVPGNSKEIVFKMQTSVEPFALIKIGDTTKWIREILQDYIMTERYEDASIFSRINSHDSSINILMGSRAFYEGWDSNRPNIILFVNIGVGKDARKFVLQAVGRGVRIEPVKGKRQRLQYLHISGGLEDNSLHQKIREDARALESLFVYGTNAENLKSVIQSLRGEGRGKVFDLGKEFIVNPDAHGRLLLVPVYKKSGKLFSETQNKHSISKADLDCTRGFLGGMSDRVLLAKYGRDLDVAVLEKTRAGVAQMSDYQESRSIGNPELIADRLFDYFGIQDKELDKFAELGEEDIVHFRKIKFSGSATEYETLKGRTKVIIENPASLRDKKLDEAFASGDKEKYDEMSSMFKAANDFGEGNSRVLIKHLANHYYHPLLVATSDKAEYLSHIIRVPSEVAFIKALEDNPAAFSEFDWWMFSKLDETLDNIYIPYYDPGQNRITDFNPDFVFWMRKGKEYRILFVDPKGAVHASYQPKADGYNRLFGGTGHEKSFPQAEHDSVNVKVYLRFFGSDVSEVGEGYRAYWADSIEKLSAGLL